MSSAVSAGVADGCMTWLSTTRTTMSIAASRCAASTFTSYGATRSATTSFAAASNDSAWVVSSGNSSVSAPCVAETTACRSRLSCASSSTARDASRIAPTRSSGCRSKAALTTWRKRSSSARIIASARAGLVPISL